MLYSCSTGFHIIKNPRKHKHRQFHFAFTGNGNKRLRHAIRCFVLVPAFEGLNSESGWCAVPACPSFLWKLSPDFHDTGPESGAQFPAKPSAGNRDTVWILHKIFPCHADSGRRIYIRTKCDLDANRTGVIVTLWSLNMFTIVPLSALTQQFFWLSRQNVPDHEPSKPLESWLAQLRGRRPTERDA